MNWNAFAIGDFKNANPQTQEERRILEESVEHLKDIDLYKEVYNKESYNSYPPEFSQGMALDTRLQKIKEIIVDHSFKNILDVGCRIGLLLFNLYENKLIETGLGIDINKSAIDLCERYKLQKKLFALNFQELMFEDYFQNMYTWHNTGFDCVVMAEVLEHCIEPVKFLNIARQLTNYVIVSVPVHTPHTNGKGNDWKYQEHVRCLKGEEMQTLLKTTGWKQVEYFQRECYCLIDIYLLQKV